MRLDLFAERLVYRVIGVPITLRARFGEEDASAGSVIRRALANHYWRPRSARDWVDLVSALVLWPLVLVGASAWYTARNARFVRARSGKGALTQAAEQLRLYFSAGILAPWYYIFDLHRDGERRAPTFLQRAETKSGIYNILRPKADASPFNDKQRFTERCEANGVRCVPYLLWLTGSAPTGGLPDRDLFVKPVRGQGGRGAERWDRIGPRVYASDGVELSEAALLDRLTRTAQSKPLLVQPRLRPHPAVANLTSGALPTVRALTCMNEAGEPELVAAVFRMSIGSNRTVDNIHAGGLGCRVSLEDGSLGQASNLGTDARLGWIARHPDTEAQIEGARLPLWDETQALALAAHRAFADRLYAGWDIGISDEGPVIIEGNSGPDMDLMQRFMDIGFCEHRFGELLAFHLKARGFAA
jgi:hypothetical protein